MPIEAWPDEVPYAPDLNSISGVKRFLDPLKTDMEGGNTRRRSRPGDNIATISQTIVMTAASCATFIEWVKTNLNNGTARFTTRVRLAATFESKVCQFSAGPTYQPIGSRAVAVVMTLLVYDV